MLGKHVIESYSALQYLATTMHTSQIPALQLSKLLAATSGLDIRATISTPKFMTHGTVSFYSETNLTASCDWKRRPVRQLPHASAAHLKLDLVDLQQHSHATCSAPDASNLLQLYGDPTSQGD